MVRTIYLFGRLSQFSFPSSFGLSYNPEHSNGLFAVLALTDRFSDIHALTSLPLVMETTHSVSLSIMSPFQGKALVLSCSSRNF